jgi:molybdate transport system substrate-binding protein
MDRRWVLRWLGVVGLSVSLGMACRPNSPGLDATSPAGDTTPATLLVGAAASLQAAMEDIQPEFEAAHPTITLEYTFAASGQLQQQIEQGAPIDVFFSAGTSQIEALEAGGHLRTDSRQNLLGNQLVLIVPSTSTLGLTGFDDLTQTEVQQISVGDFGSVPAGQYAEQVLGNLGILADLQPKLIFVNTVREVLAAVASNNVEAGILFATDAATSDQVTVVAIAADTLHDPIVYPLAVVNDTAHPEAAQTLVDYLSSPAARTVFEDHGFTVLD